MKNIDWYKDKCAMHLKKWELAKDNNEHESKIKFHMNEYLNYYEMVERVTSEQETS